ncbi:hypothetical protein KTH02_03690 [Acinetobacter radioresistens]|nr:hypothetical protein [Acinetobacter radioresistens]MCU4517697.1 hypothetical protein [Acinetobacter radioresistens]
MMSIFKCSNGTVHVESIFAKCSIPRNGLVKPCINVLTYQQHAKFLNMARLLHATKKAHHHLLRQILKKPSASMRWRDGY